jgi:hypothetical protein
MGRHHSTLVELGRDLILTVMLLSVVYGGAVFLVEMLRP